MFLFVGGGPRQDEVKTVREDEGLPNIRLLDSVPRELLHVSLSLADAHLISMRPEMTGIVVPGKLYGAMAAGRPVVFVGPEHCESADTIRQCRLRIHHRARRRPRPGRGTRAPGVRSQPRPADG